jgi:lipoprotein-anchoring transpeptidase ErfK/SrfK
LTELAVRHNSCVGRSADKSSLPRASSRRPRLLLAAVAGLVPVIPIVIGLLLSAGPTSTAAATAASRSPFTPVAVPRTRLKSTPTAIPPGSGALVALVHHATPLRRAPGGSTIARLSTRTSFGSPEAVWVVQRSGSWLGVISTQAGNGHVGWIAASATSLSRVGWELKVSLSARRLTVLDRGTVAARYAIAVGAPASPTPTGRFAVTDRLLTGDPSGPYGCCILALSALAPHAIQSWDGGDRIAIHSTPETDTIGEDVSHGCMRLTLAEGRWLIDHIPLGTPTLISS